MPRIHLVQGPGEARLVRRIAVRGLRIAKRDLIQRTVRFAERAARKRGRQERRRIKAGLCIGTNADEARQILIFSAQAINDPRPKLGRTNVAEPVINFCTAAACDGVGAAQRFDEAQLVGDLRRCGISSLIQAPDCPCC